MRIRIVLVITSGVDDIDIFAKPYPQAEVVNDRVNGVGATDQNWTCNSLVDDSLDGAKHGLIFRIGVNDVEPAIHRGINDGLHEHA